MNGGFEVETVPDSRFAWLLAPGWSSTAANLNEIELWHTGYRGVDSNEGVQHAELNSRKADSIFQTVEVVDGSTYMWSIDHRARRDVDVLEVIINGISQGQFSADVDEWVTHSGYYTVFGESELTIEFKAIDEG